jgi:hypothetical protein
MVDGWEVFEEESYERAVAQLGTHEFFDEGLAPITYALNRDPTGFQKVPGFPDIHLAKAKLRFIGMEIVPSYRLWFRINPVAMCVYKLWIDLAPPEDMGFWDEEDGSPF